MELVSGGLVVTVLGLVMLAIWRGGRKADRALALRLSSRERLAMEPLVALFCGEGLTDRRLVRELLEGVAAQLSVDVALLRPTDRWDAELRPAPGWEFDSTQGAMMWALERQLKRRGLSMAKGSVITLGDYLRAMAQTG